MPYLLLLVAVSIGPRGAPIRTGCRDADPVVATLPPTVPVELRFALNDGSQCYKISTIADGQPIEGYVQGALLQGLAEFERELRSAPDGSSVRTLIPASHSKKPELKQPLREEKPDGASEILYGLRVLLRYEAGVIRPEVARSLVAVLDEQVTRISNELGCSQDDRLVAILQSRRNFLKSTDAAEWSGGLYDGRIHVPVPDGPVNQAELSRVLAHEVVHACLAALSPSWPTWLHEGLAQRLSGASLPQAELVRIRQLAASHGLPRLENLAQSWSRMSGQHARLAYNVALAAADLLWENYAAYGIRNVLSDPTRFSSITSDLDRKLGL